MLFVEMFNPPLLRSQRFNVFYLQLISSKAVAKVSCSSRVSVRLFFSVLFCPSVILLVNNLSQAERTL